MFAIASLRGPLQRFIVRIHYVKYNNELLTFLRWKCIQLSKRLQKLQSLPYRNTRELARDLGSLFYMKEGLKYIQDDQFGG